MVCAKPKRRPVRWFCQDAGRSRGIDVELIYSKFPLTSTYDHTSRKTRDPVRSPQDKPGRAGLVVGSVTTSEYPVLYVFFFYFFFFAPTFEITDLNAINFCEGLDVRGYILCCVISRWRTPPMLRRVRRRRAT